MVAGTPDFGKYVMAVERVERLLRDVSTALDRAKIPYAVIGGNAVAAWVATADEGATRATKDVDLLVRRSDLPAIAAAVAPLNLYADEAGGIPVLIDRDKPRPSEGVHLLFAGEQVHQWRSRFPEVEDSVRSSAGYQVIGLRALLVMKLDAHRRVDQVHVEDMLRVGLITAETARDLPAPLLNRLREIRDTMEWNGPAPQF